MHNTWMKRIGFVALVGGFYLVGYGLGITPAAAEPPVKESALSGITQNWDKSLPSSSRFTVLRAFDGAAVRDNNTGLVWEQAPDSTPRIWVNALAYCLNKNVGGTRGWRLPSVVELASLIDPSLPPPFVSTSVFTGVQAAFYYWSATLNAVDPSGAWGVPFNNSNVVNVGKSDPNFVWCVRGAMNADAY